MNKEIMKYHIKNEQGERTASFKYEYDRDHFFALCDKPNDKCEKEDACNEKEKEKEI